MSVIHPAIVSFGSINVDLTVHVDTFPKAGETKHASNYAIGLGGKGANQAAAVARLCQDSQTKTALIGRVGADDFGIFAKDTLAAFGVETSLVHTDPSHATGIALINIDAKGENCITVVGAANMAVSEIDIEKNIAQLENASVLLLQLECPLTIVTKAAAKTHSAGGQVILDPAPAPQDDLPKALLYATDVITPNETETYRLTNILPDTPERVAQAAEKLLQKGVRAVVIKMGHRGTYWHDGTKGDFVKPFSVTAIDTVAAGDCFNAGLAVALNEGKLLPEAVRFASACGALATTKKGAADAAPTREEVEKLLSSY
ncbi:ribokinase [Acetobacter indonesiensis]|uniref:ribokinase n=1 Tax=Acetobacter indonesiensis TaxID=104101 RepID=UPI001EFFA310|nr:ribokinase [Acetobacter indonesiensis]MCG0996144.1 ribokinase [Acetobacter indonesiensis]